MGKLIIGAAVALLSGCGATESGSRRDASADSSGTRGDASTDSRTNDSSTGNDTGLVSGDSGDSGRDAAQGCDSGAPGVGCLAMVGPEYVTGRMTVDEENVYWGVLGQTVEKSAIMKASRIGGPIVTLATDTLPNSMVSDGNNLYWAYAASGILSVPVGGGQVATLVSTTTGVGCIALDQDNVYWTGGGGNAGLVASVPKVGGAPTTISTTEASAIAVDEDNVYWFGASGVMVASKAGGNTTTLLAITASGPWCRALALAGGDVVANGYTPSEIVAIPATGSDASTVLFPNETPSDYSQAMVANGTDVFSVTLAASLEIEELPISGVPTTVLAMPDTQAIYDIAIAPDGTLYWATGSQIQSIKP